MIFEYESVVQLCQELGISRMTFYRWEVIQPLTKARLNTPLKYFNITRPVVYDWLQCGLYELTRHRCYLRAARRFKSSFFAEFLAV